MIRPSFVIALTSFVLGLLPLFVEVVHVAGALSKIDIDLGVYKRIVGSVKGPRTSGDL